MQLSLLMYLRLLESHCYSDLLESLTEQTGEWTPAHLLWDVEHTKYVFANQVMKTVLSCDHCTSSVATKLTTSLWLFHYCLLNLYPSIFFFFQRKIKSCPTQNHTNKHRSCLLWFKTNVRILFFVPKNSIVISCQSNFFSQQVL